MKNRKRLMLLGGIAVAAGVLLGESAARASFCYSCGSNSATVGDGIVFDELNSKGLERINGPRITGARLADGTKVTLKVHRHYLSAVAVAGRRTYAGDELVGMIVDLKMKDGRAYQLKLLTAWDGCLNVDTTCHDNDKDHKGNDKDRERRERLLKQRPRCNPQTFWVSPFEDVPYYDFVVRKTSRRTNVGALDADNPKTAADPKLGPDRPLDICVPGKTEGYGKTESYKPGQPRTCPDRCQEEEFKEHLCKGPFHSDDDLWSNIHESAIVFAGDHYDVDKKTVSKIPEASGWFNLACTGTASYKMHMLRHTEAGSITLNGVPRDTTLQQRTAMLKAITADYCGDGRSWTGDGTKLYWTDARGWYQWPSANILGEPESRGIEAIWGPDGALCLNTPRRLPEAPPPQATKCDIPAVQRQTVEQICRGTKRAFTASPPVPGVKASSSPQIPNCDAAWADWWRREAGKSPTSAFPYVMSVNVEKHADAVNYCNPPGQPVPP
jgi:hypothetical protein